MSPSSIIRLTDTDTHSRTRQPNIDKWRFFVNFFPVTLHTDFVKYEKLRRQNKFVRNYPICLCTGTHC